MRWRARASSIWMWERLAACGGWSAAICMMIGGDKTVVDRLDPIFKALAPGAGTIEKTPSREKADPRVTEGYMHVGPAGLGPFRQDGP